MHYLKTLIQSRLQGTPFVTLSEAVSVTQLRRRLFLQADGAEPEEGQVDKGDMGGEERGLYCTGELCQRETEGQGLNFFLRGYCKPESLPSEPCASYTCHSGIKDEMLTRQTTTTQSIPHLAFPLLHISLSPSSAKVVWINDEILK